ncbi:TetR/AcrR family transcriptional regulator C-terminal domain-containing protein [Kitasatospora sp. NPDC094015]|uniref:TetR/AcrR family transcriptional regulator n=1 Tax=Kitasatospora sp. NPDC094015 TaxID=3155205 RepID=UPI00332C1862
MNQASRSGRGGRPAQISVDRITAAAIEVVDREGLDALTMRRIGAHLGVAAMSLYRHLPGRDAILSAVVDQLFASAVADLDPGPAWPDALTAFAVAYRRMLLEHPNAVPLLATHPVSPDTAVPALAALLERFTAAGVPEDEALIRIQSVGVFTLGHALAQVGSGGSTEDHDTGPAAPDPTSLDYYQRWFDAGLQALVAGFEHHRTPE